MFLTSPHESADPSLAELLQFSSRALARKRPVQRRSSVPAVPAERLPDGDIALQLRVADLESRQSLLAPVSPTLAPLRDRDLQVMHDWFAASQMEAMETDILDNLKRLSPEPCWEDDPFGSVEESELSFLADYL